MTLQASGAISFSDINTELGLSSTSQISMNDAAVRTLFSQASGAISMTAGYGKSNTSTPGAPTSVSASATSYSSASVSFSAPACTGHLTIDYYQVISSPGCITATGTSPISVTGLSGSTSYTFRVRAHNSKGYGCYSSSSGSITTPAATYSISAALVAGGGSGNCGGPGAGGVIKSTSLTLTIGTQYAISVGAGGTAGNGTGSGFSKGFNSSVGSLVTAYGGGRGTTFCKSGGSGAGTSGYGCQSPGSGVSGQGYAGGYGTTAVQSYYTNRGGGGGGGAGGVGGCGSSGTGGAGGPGVSYPCGFGWTYPYAGGYAGGGGGGCGYYNGACGGSGGGGHGQGQGGRGGTNGSAYTGGGGGQYCYSQGGSGNVVLKIPNAYYTGTYTGGASVVTSVSGYTILFYTGSGTYTA